MILNNNDRAIFSGVPLYVANVFMRRNNYFKEYYDTNVMRHDLYRWDITDGS